MPLPEVITPETLAQFSAAVDDLYTVTHRSSGTDVSTVRMIKDLTHRMAIGPDQSWEVTIEDSTTCQDHRYVSLRLGDYRFQVGVLFLNDRSGAAALDVLAEGVREAMRKFIAPFTALALNTAEAMEAADKLSLTVPPAVTDFIASRGVRPDPQWREMARKARATALTAMGTSRN